MRRLLAASALLVALALASSSASAETYLGLGIGKDAPVTGSFGERFSTDKTRHGRVFLGKRFGQLAIEGVIFGTEFTRPNGNGDFNTLSLGVDAKYYFSLMLNFSAYLKGGIHKTWVQAPEENATLDSYSGTGHAIGAGLEYRFALAGIWLDYNRQSVLLKSEQAGDLEAGAKMLTLGATLSF